MSVTAGDPPEEQHDSGQGDRSDRVSCPLKTERASTWWMVVSVIAISFVLFATALREGHDWGGDYAQYLLHAQAILDGLPYAPPPGYVDNPFLPLIPPAYPPVLPVAYVGLLAVFGLNFVALKMLTVLSITMGLFIYWRFLRPSLSPSAALGALAFLAFSPYMLKFSNKILSDIPYIVVSIATILAGERFFRKKSAVAGAAFLCGMFVFLGMTRFIGVTLILAAPIYALLFKRSHLVLTGVASVLSIVVLNPLSGGTVSGYVDVVGLDISRMLMWLEGKPQGYFYNLTRYLAIYPGHNSLLHSVVNIPVSAIYLGLSALGLVSLVRKHGVRFRDAYVFAYVGALFVYSDARLRYLVPIVPLVSLYAFQGLRVVTALVRTQLRQRGLNAGSVRRVFRYRFLLPTAIYAPLFLAYWSHYTFKPVTPEANILKNPDVAGMFDFVRENGDEVSGAIFDRPRVLSLFTDARATWAFNTEGLFARDVRWDYSMLLELADVRDISHLILSKTNDATTLTFRPIVTANPDRFQLVYQNPTYSIYQIHPAEAGRAEAESSNPNTLAYQNRLSTQDWTEFGQ